MDVDDASSSNDSEEDEEYLRNPHEIAIDRDGSDADAESDRENMDEDDDDGDDHGDDNGDSDQSAAGSSDLEGPLVTRTIQLPVRHAGVELVSYYNIGMTTVARLLRRQSPLDVPKDTIEYRFLTRFQQDFYQSII